MMTDQGPIGRFENTSSFEKNASNLMLGPFNIYSANYSKPAGHGSVFPERLCALQPRPVGRGCGYLGVHKSSSACMAMVDQ